MPLASFLWPREPRWWYRLWAAVGVRSAQQQGRAWREVADANQRYAREGLSYWSNRRYRAVSALVFGNCEFPMGLYLKHAPGRVAAIIRRLPFKPLLGLLVRETRTMFLAQRNAG